MAETGANGDNTPATDGVLSWAKQIWGDFTKQHGDLAAAAIAVFGLLSLIPALLLAVWLYVALIAHSPQQAWAAIKPHVDQMLSGAGSGGGLPNMIEQVVMSSHTAGVAGAIGLVWAGSRIFNIISEAFNEAWSIPTNRAFLKQNVVSLLMLLVIGAVFLVSVGLDAALPYFERLFTDSLHLPYGGAIGAALSIGLNVLTSIALFVVLYKWAPNRRVKWRPALFGGVIGGILWAAFQQGFRFYLDHFASYNKMYGTMAAFFILVLWAYYSAYILVLGAVASAVYSERVLGEKGPDSATEHGKKIKTLRGAELSRETHRVTTL